MRLDRIDSGSRVFIDTNIFIYHFTGVSAESSNFLNRCEQNDLEGITSLNVLLEVLHRLMMVEAVRRSLIKPPNIIKKLKKSPEKVKQLNEYFLNTLRIPEMGILIKPVSYDSILRSQAIRAAYGLMVNDSLIMASMQEEGISLLATNDDAFKRIKSHHVHKPGDVKLS